MKYDVHHRSLRWEGQLEVTVADIGAAKLLHLLSGRVGRARPAHDPMDQMDPKKERCLDNGPLPFDPA